MRYAHALAALSLIGLVGVAEAADRKGAVVVPEPAIATNTCADAGVLGRIQSRFAYAERTEWHRGFVIRAIGNPRLGDHHFAEPGLVKRDYCKADATMTDGSKRAVYYAIEHGLGFAGVGRNVDFCVEGLDPWHIYDGDCRTVR